MDACARRRHPRGGRLALARLTVGVLTVNAGSTSLKLATVEDGVAVTHPDGLNDVLHGPTPDCVAHRVVHGGDRHGAVRVDNDVVAELQSLTELAPLHQPAALRALAQCRDAWPDVPNVACFDTAFHATLPEAARTYALPARYRDDVKVYGFHGLAHSWAVGRIAALAPDARRVLVAHLGGGQSLCGALDGRSVITTMGFTPVDGLVMASRSGALDPGALLWLNAHHPGDDLETVLQTESGLLGLCGTGDMREVHRRADSGDRDARLAFEVWRHRLTTLAGGCIAALGGLDAIVFSGGIGEHDPRARAALVDALAWLGVVADDDCDAPDDVIDITGRGSSLRVFVVHTREDLQMAAEAQSLLTGDASTDR